MNKLLLINSPEVFQGKKNLNLDGDYFEGWYYKITNGIESMAFIPGISISKEDRKAFIQVITNDSSYYVDYDIREFEYGFEPFYVKIGNNYFSRDRIHIDIGGKEQELVIEGDVSFRDSCNIDSSIGSPNIMGIFAFVPFMECNHAIISMKNKTSGGIRLRDRNFIFDKGIGYIEKDWGRSFPKNYIWCQGNNFSNDRVSFMFSIADIPYGVFSFRGFICSLIIEGKEYRFATYNRAKVIKCEVKDNGLEIVLKKGHYYLEIEADKWDGYKLSAPVKGKMEKDIVESISSKVRITFKYDEEVIFRDTSLNCGLEIVLE